MALRGTPAVENDDYTVNGIVIDFNKSGQYKIIGDGQEVTDKASFHVGNDFEGEITLKDVKVNLNGIRSAFKVESDAKLTLLEVVKSFTISKADSKISITTETRDKGYDEKPVAEPVVEKAGSTNAVSFTWYQKKGDTWEKIGGAPKNAGSYKVEALVAADDNYNSAAAEKLFEIKKAIPSYTLPQELLIKQGEALSSVQLPTGFTWVDPAQKAETLGAQTFKAIFTPTDTMNYESVEVNIHLNVVPQGTPINTVPSIHAEDKILTIGDAFDVMAGVSAQDAEDGDLSAAIEVVKNTVGLAKPGVYEVTYRVRERLRRKRSRLQCRKRRKSSRRLRSYRQHQMRVPAAVIPNQTSIKIR